MLNRWLGIATFCLMLSVNAALFLRDLAPALTAGDPPASGLFELGVEEDFTQRIGIYDESNRLVGVAWTLARKTGDILTMRTWTLFEPITIAGTSLRSRVFIRTELLFNARKRLDSLHVIVYGLGDPLDVRGEFVEPDNFACKWQRGGVEGAFNLPADLLRTFSDATRPLDNMRHLRVGQTWRMHTFDPLGGVLARDGGASFAGYSTIVRVTGQENLFHNGENVPVFLVESDRAVAWIAPDGRVLRQEAELPLLGRLVLIDEPYDNRERLQQLDASGY